MYECICHGAGAIYFITSERIPASTAVEAHAVCIQRDHKGLGRRE